MILDLFSPEPQANLLPFDGQVQDLGLILTAEQSAKYLDYFLAHLAWQPDEVVLYGKRMSRNEKWCGMAMLSINITIRAVPSKHCYGIPLCFV